jgi:ElaB/YqjD/DUF883 family membrane-anchored ribosome-binding protein
MNRRRGSNTIDLSDEKIAEALNILTEAAKEKKADLMDMMGGRYGDLKEVLSEHEERISEVLADTAHRIKDSISSASKSGQKRIVETAQGVDERVHDSPWKYIGGVALGAMILGYFFGRK